MVRVSSPTGLLFFLCLLGAWVYGKMPLTMTNDVRYAMMGETTMCRTIPGLTKSQVEVCYQQPDTTAIAIEGLKMAIDECQHQFQGHRWNCTSLATKARNPYTSVMFKKGYRETAFAYALSAAGVAISVSKACSQGSLVNCGCNPKKYKMKNPASLWKWGGCSDNVKYGTKFSKLFLDTREEADDIHSRINLHNNEVGRTVVANNMQVKCKCHGMSGSCELKTCWRTTPDYRVVGRLLKEKYRSAVLVDQSNLGNRMPKTFQVRRTKERRKKPRGRMKQWLPSRNKTKRDLSFYLLYYQKSPNFCETDPRLDVSGTSGRQCNTTSTGADSCSSLCCGRGYNLLRRRRVERCNCKFHWCCTVECQTCNVEEWVTVCK